MKRIRSHENDTSNFSPALIQPHVKKRPLTGLQFDVQRKITLILCESHFCANDCGVVTFTPQNYASKSNSKSISKSNIISAMIMKSDQARKCKKT